MRHHRATNQRLHAAQAFASEQSSLDSKTALQRLRSTRTKSSLPARAAACAQFRAADASAIPVIHLPHSDAHPGAAPRNSVALCCNMRIANVLIPRETRKQSIGATLPPQTVEK